MHTKMNFKNLEQDNVFVPNAMVSMQKLTGYESRKGLESAIISNGKLVNVVSDGYGHLPNEKLFLKVEEELLNADIMYNTRSINRNDRSFAVDYLLSDENFIIQMKNGENPDKLIPMLRFVNSYDGSCKVSGNFGFYREVCSNGLHIATQSVGFSLKKRGDIQEIVLPEIRMIVKKFIDNEYFTLYRKFETLQEKHINGFKFIQDAATALKLFKFEASDSNPAPSLNATIAIDTIRRESKQLGQKENAWLG